MVSDESRMVEEIEMTAILGTGLSGLVGSRIVELLKKEYSFENLSIETGVDITNQALVEKRIAESSAPWVFHFAAYTDVQAAEKEKDKGTESISWKVNVEATKNIASICQAMGKHVLYLSTDYVFDGTASSYDEDAIPNPQGWYAKTKYEGEKIIKNLSSLGLVVRIANPYRANPTGKKDFVHKVLERLQQGLPISAPGDQQMTATFIDDLALAVQKLIGINASGIYNVPGKNSFSPYDGAITIASQYGLDTTNVSKTSFEAYFAGRAPIPQNGILIHDKIESLGVLLHTLEEGVIRMKQMEGLTI
jgi:dTDP-4-dehydrorhamnose reductase